MARDKQNDWRAGLGSSLGLDQCSSVLVKGGRRKFSLRVPFSIQQNSERTSKETITIPWEEARHLLPSHSGGFAIEILIKAL